MTSSRPYLIRALHEWIVDNDLTPHLIVDAAADGVQVPREFVEDGRIVLNVSPSAATALVLGNELIEFNARFGGVSRHIVVPPEAVLAIYSRETGVGMVFQDAGGDDGSTPDGPDDGPSRPALKIVK
jgi:stringent starvation protein B